MSKDPKTLDRVILSHQDFGWTSDKNLALDGEDLAGLIACFGEVDSVKRSQLESDLRRTFQSLIVCAAAERPDSRSKNNRVARPSSVALAELKALGQTIAELEDKLDSLQAETLSLIDYHFENTIVLDPEENSIYASSLREQTFKILELWSFAEQLGSIGAGHGPNHTSIRMALERLAKIWQRYVGAAPTVNRGRGKSDPFLEFCQKFVTLARPRVQALDADFGTLALTGIVSEVVKELRPDRS